MAAPVSVRRSQSRDRNLEICGLWAADTLYGAIAMTAGHSTTPLADELGLKPGMRVFTADMPDSVRTAIALDGLGLTLLAAPSAGIDTALIFVATREKLECEVNALRQLVAPGGFIWVSWPENQAASDLTDAVAREITSPIGLVEVKNSAIADGWSALKLTIRRGLP